MCNNAKLAHPWKTYRDEFGAEVPEQISFCHYHAKFCLDPNRSHGDHLVKIKEPNEFALCNECFVQKMKRPPPALPKFRIPGVARASRNLAVQTKLAGKSLDTAAEGLTEDTLCDWKPNRHIIAERGLSCCNKVFRNPETKALCRQCGWHLEECCMTHKDSDPSKKRIAIPNPYGLCVAHYVSKFGAPPPRVPLPFPGMEKKVKEEEKLMTIEEQLSHPLRPRGAGPEMMDPPAVYVPPLPPRTVKQKFAKMTAERRRNIRLKTIGIACATRIQKNYRMYACQVLREQKFKQRLAINRHKAAVNIQKIARRYIQKEEVAEIKKNTVNAVNLVIRLTRGLLARKKVKKKKAALVLQRGGLRAVASALMFAVKSTLEVRHEHKHEEWGNMTLQRYAKGFVTRLRVKQKREQMKKEIWASLVLQRRYRGRIGRRRFDHLTRVKLWEDSNACVVQSAIRRRLCTTYVQCRRIAWNKAALQIQRLALMFIAKMVVYHERKSIQMFWDWLAPTLPKSAFDFLLPKTFYGSKVFNIKPSELRGMNTAELSLRFAKLKEEALLQEDIQRLELDGGIGAGSTTSAGSTSEYDLPGEQFFRKYDPDACTQVSRLDFAAALQDMWDSAGCPLLKSECSALINRFDHHNDGWIDYHRFLRFASRHEKPCAVHGRLVCAECISYGECIKNGMVVCSKFIPQIASPNVCTCGHYVTAHEMIPEPNLDEEYVNGVISKHQMDGIFRKEKRPDLEKPARGGKGMRIGDVLSLTRYQIEKEAARVGGGHNLNVAKGGNTEVTPSITMRQILNGTPSTLNKAAANLSPPKPPALNLRNVPVPALCPIAESASDSNKEASAVAKEAKLVRAEREEKIQAIRPDSQILVPRQGQDPLTKSTSSLPNRDQHFQSIKFNQYEKIGNMVKSQRELFFCR